MKKCLLILSALLLASCSAQTVTTALEDPMLSLTRQVAQSPDSVSFASYWEAYLESPQSLKTVTAQAQYLEAMASVESGKKICEEINWQQITQQNTFSLLPHLSATECYETLGKTELALFHQNIFNFIATGILGKHSGDTYYSAYEIASWGDAEDLLTLSGYEIIDSYFEFAESRNGLYRIYNVRTQDNNKVAKIYFDNSRFLHRLLAVEHPFAGLSDALYREILQPLANSDYAARHAVGQVYHAEEEFQKAEQAYLDAIGMGSVTANISLGKLCLAGKSTRFSQSECAQLFVSASDLGLEEAKIVLAYMALTGLGIEADPALAEQLLNSAAVSMPPGQAEYEVALLMTSTEFTNAREKLAQDFRQVSASKGYPPAQLALALDRLSSDQKPLEDFEAFIQQAVDTNFPPAQFFYARYLLKQKGEHSVKTGLALLDKAASADFPPALNLRARIAEEGLFGRKIDTAQALRDYEAAAVRWYPPAQLHMGILNSTGRLTATNQDIAYGWYALCAKANNLDCITNLGYATAHGRGVEQNYPRAVEIYQYASAQGSARASYNLGQLYRLGQGVSRNLEQAIDYLTQAAEGGSTDAMNALGLVYLDSAPEFHSYSKALSWFERAAENNSRYGYFNQARMYEQGLGVENDPSRALAHYRKASDLGHDIASLKLAQAYSSGEAVDKDLKMAAHFFKLAAEQGNDGKIKRALEMCQESQNCIERNLDRLFNLLSSEE
ncbi:tetratricopeptide repeat protein [Microbulbifer sp. 2205BS26-8]|uniref:tetratricopeptide repeat protein n=1 Tax=Microbulbifer sp. 2205BS26-8 TaxID=3064386 RepID=UPI00273DFA50|nr:tetratricopeptide repeat protein [Microbulbifer sp. 2205BS26-8]MDP5209446.1 tetratricopeptide repeat protein [Microbulbifer sp. 2205BS26-8]